MPVDVGEAIAAYLQKGRPASQDRHLFERSIAPIRGLMPGSYAIGTIARSALQRAGSTGLSPIVGAALYSGPYIHPVIGVVPSVVVETTQSATSSRNGRFILRRNALKRGSFSMLLSNGSPTISHNLESLCW
jgi:hypothetical protein